MSPSPREWPTSGGAGLLSVVLLAQSGVGRAGGLLQEPIAQHGTAGGHPGPFDGGISLLGPLIFLTNFLFFLPPPSALLFLFPLHIPRGVVSDSLLLSNLQAWIKKNKAGEAEKETLEKKLKVLGLHPRHLNQNAKAREIPQVSKLKRKAGCRVCLTLLVPQYLEKEA